MTTRVTAAANAIAAIMRKNILDHVPFLFRDAAESAVPALAGECADAALKAADAVQAKPVDVIPAVKAST